MRRYDWALLLFFLVVFMAPLFYSPLSSPREYATISIAESMVAEGNYLVPSLLAEVQPFRPVVSYWLTAAGIEIFGRSPLALFFFPALAIGLSTLLLYLITFQCSDDKTLSQLSAFFFMGCFMVMNYRALPVSVCIGGFFTLASLYAFFLGAREDRFNLQRFNLLAISGLCAAAAMLSRGVVTAVLILLIILIYLVAERRFRDMLTLVPVAAAAFVLALSPYFMLLAGEELPFIELLKDASSRAFLRGDGDYPRLLGTTAAKLILPCGVFLLLLFCKSAREGRLGHLPVRNSLGVFSIVMIAATAAFYSFASTATAGDLYITAAPLAFIAALVTVDYLRGSNRRRAFHRLLNIAGAAMIAAAIWILVREFVNSPYPFVETIGFGAPYMLLPAAFAIWGGLILISARDRAGIRMPAFCAGLVLCFLAYTVRNIRSDRTEKTLENFRLLFESGGSVIYATPDMIHLTACVTGRPDVRYFSGPASKIDESAADGRRFKDCITNAAPDSMVILLSRDCPERLFGPESGSLPRPGIFPCGEAILYVWPPLKEEKPQVKQ